MSLYTALRRATAAAVPLLSRRAAATSSRTFHSAIAVNLLRQNETTHFVPSRSFAYGVLAKTPADDTLLRVLNSEIDCALEDNDSLSANLEFPGDFPFEVEDNPGERTIQLKRQFEDETITVQVDIPNVAPQQSEDEAGPEKIENENDSESSIPLVVTVFKGNGVCMEFGVTAFPDEVVIDSLSIKNPDESEDQLVYEGPEFTDLDENLQKAFLKYLEIRGITPNTTNFLQEYMFNKDNKEYLGWLKKLKSFIEK